jgi:aegerolysin
MAARSTDVYLTNQTPSSLSRTYANLSHGEWTEDLPPEKIEPSNQSHWKSESKGFLTGTEGIVKYHLDGAGEVMIHWDNPFVGSNSYTNSAPKGYEISHSGGSGNNASVEFTLKLER